MHSAAAAAASTALPRFWLTSARMSSEATRLAAALADHVDDGLGARAQAVGQGHEQELRAGAVQRVAQRAVGALQQQRGHQAAAEGHAGGAQRR